MEREHPLSGWQAFWHGFWLGLLAGLAWHLIRHPAVVGCLLLVAVALTVLTLVLFWHQLAILVTAVFAGWLGLRAVRAWRTRQG